MMNSNNSNLTLKAKLGQPPKVDFWFFPSFSSSNLFFNYPLKSWKFYSRKMVNFKLFDLEKGQTSIKHIINPK